MRRQSADRPVGQPSLSRRARIALAGAAPAEKEVLADLYAGTHGANWLDQDGWYGATLCPNFLHTPSPNDGAWNTATIAITPDPGRVTDAIDSNCGGMQAAGGFLTGPFTVDCVATPAPTLGECALALSGLAAAGLGAHRLRRVRMLLD
ncbi:IPTL-CTERM sorting domain-containing protein [Acidovorax sp. SDU_ACID1]|uniref:IPTL-CTERM sorting domain-containing protein n=1 Tax=Acidovorax sp. SDU_ACID1 TaxID=3136632 RepID=UPI0038730392